LSNPEQPLARLINDINRAAIRSTWALYRPTAKNAAGKELNLHIRGSGWLLERQEGVAKDTVYQWLIRGLEQDKISDLGRCRTCGKFFIRNRWWQRDCSGRCKKAYDNALSAERKADRAVKVKTEKATTKKRDLYNLLSSPAFQKRLKGGPSQRARTQALLLKKLDGAPSVQEFLKNCEPYVQKSIENMM